MATATMKVELDGNALNVTTTFKGETKTERLVYDSPEAAEAALERVASLDGDEIARRSGAEFIRMSRVDTSELHS